MLAKYLSYNKNINRLSLDHSKMCWCFSYKRKKGILDKELLDNSDRETSITWQESPMITETYSKEEYDRTIDNQKITQNKIENKVKKYLQKICNTKVRDEEEDDN
jgi:hypothetical protein